jgi:hypothetical protein
MVLNATTAIKEETNRLLEVVMSCWSTLLDSEKMDVLRLL